MFSFTASFFAHYTFPSFSQVTDVSFITDVDYKWGFSWVPPIHQHCYISLLLCRCGSALCCLSLSSSSSLIVFIPTLTLLLPCSTFSCYDRFCLSLQLLFPHPKPSSLHPLFPLSLPKSIYTQLFKLSISLLFSSFRFFPHHDIPLCF